jgi:hypothetical protein
VVQFFLFFLLSPAVLAGASLRSSGVTALTPHQAEEFFLLAGATAAFSGEEALLSVDGAPVRIVADGERFCVTCGDKTIAVDAAMEPLRPIAATLPLVPFDLLCPFFHWEEVCYEGPSVALGRPVQRFTAISSDGWTVRVQLDAKFFYPLCWDLSDPTGKLSRRFRLRSIVRDAAGGWKMGRAQVIAPADGRTVTVVPGQF